jgi:hypothetical protein
MAVAYCWATGVIRIGETLPDGAIPLAIGDPGLLTRVVGGLATMAWDNVIMLIPGFGLAEDSDAKLDAVSRFADLVQASLQGGQHG